MKSLEAFVLSPYFNTNEEATKLIQYLKRCHPDFPEKKLSEAKVYRAVWGRNKPTSRKANQLFNRTLSLVEQFVAVEKLQSDSLLQNQLLLTWQRHNAATAQVEKSYKESQKILQKRQIKEPFLYYQDFQIEALYYAHSMEQVNRAKQNNLQSVVDKLDAYLLLEKLRYACAGMNIRQIVAADYELGELLLQALSRRSFQHIPLIGIYQLLYKLLSNQAKPAEYLQLKTLLQTHKAHISRYELRQALAFMLNHQIRQMQKRPAESREEILRIYEEMLTEDLLIREGYIIHQHFTNVVRIHLLQGYFQKAQAFLEQYANKLKPDIRTDVQTYNLANIYFYEGKYADVIRLINTLSFLDGFYHAQSKVLLLKSYYEQGNEDALNEAEFKIESFRRHLTRNKHLSDSHRKAFRRFLTLYKQLHRLRYVQLIGGTSETNLEKFEAQIRDAATAQRAWLLAKVGEFIWH